MRLDYFTDNFLDTLYLWQKFSGTNKVKDYVSLAVCANSTETHKISCALIGKVKSPDSSKIMFGIYHNSIKQGMDG